MGSSEFEDAYDDEARLQGILDETIEDLEPVRPVCVGPGASLVAAIEAMNAVKAGCVLVTEGDALVGILTERDILRVVGKLYLQTPVEQVMTRDPETVGITDGIAYALQQMHLGGFRHIPVVDEAGRPVGILSVRDFVRYVVSLFPAKVLNLPPHPRLAARSPDGG